MLDIAAITFTKFDSFAITHNLIHATSNCNNNLHFLNQ